MESLVSVLIGSYNFKPYIVQAIESVLNQVTDFEVEIYVLDDASTDGTQEILRKYYESNLKVHLLLNEVNMGGMVNIYNVLKDIKTPYITFLDGDDFWIDKDKLQKQVRYLKNNAEIAVGHMRYLVDTEGKIIGKEESISNRDYKMEDYLKYNRALSFSTLLINWGKVKDKEDWTLLYRGSKFQGDATMLILLLNNGKIKVTDECMSVYRERSISGEQNFNSIFNTRKKVEEILNIYLELNKYFDGKWSFERKITDYSADYILSAILNRERVQVKWLRRKIGVRRLCRTYKAIVLRGFRKIIRGKQNEKN